MAAATTASSSSSAITTPINAGSIQGSITITAVDASLWWDSFTLLLTDLENASSTSQLPSPLVKKLKDNRAWFLDTVRLFKPPSQKSKEALNARQIKIGSRQLTIEPELKDLALKISSLLSLDELQSYILVKRTLENDTQARKTIQHELLHMVILQYYIERQCLLKCTRQILTHALYDRAGSKEGSILCEIGQNLISDGLENSLLTVLDELLSSKFPEHMDVDLYILWAEETLIEDNLVLNILFLAYYESLSTCNGKQWKQLFLLYKGVICDSYNFGKLEISAEAIHSISHAKAQFLLILIEALDLESLLQMVHDNISFRQGNLVFSLIDIQEIDTLIAGLNAFETEEAGPLILAWAIFLCLISSLPDKPENSVLMEIDHVGYVRQAIEAASMKYFFELLQSDVLRDLEGPVAGYRCVVRTLISAFIASYEINLQSEDSNLKLILDILHQIYRGEESLCTQFWDRDSFVDSPIRCLLYSLEGEFPLRTVEFVRLLSALCEGAWPAECGFNFLDKSVGLSSLFDLNAGSMVDEASLIIENHQPTPVPGAECLTIPVGTRGHVVKMINRDIAHVRWERTHSGMLVLLLRLAQGVFMENTEEVVVILDLLSRLSTFNMGVCYALMNTGNPIDNQVTSALRSPTTYICIDLVEIVCSLVKDITPNSSGAVMMSMGVKMLAKMLKCSPSHVSTLAVKANIFDVAFRTNPFDVGSNGLSRGSWLLSGRLAKMLLIDCEFNDCMLTLSVLDFTMQFVEAGSENDVFFSLIVFSLQYVLVNHEFWKYKVKHARWKVTLKVLELLKKCIFLVPYRRKLSEVVRDILFCDNSVQSALIRLVCMTTEDLEKVYVSRLYDQMDIEGLQDVMYSGLDVLYSMLSDLPQDFPVLPVRQAILSPMTKPVPMVVAAVSFISCFRSPKIQLGAVRLLSALCAAADHLQGSTCFSLDNKQMCNLSNSINSILSEKSSWNEDLIVAVLTLLTSAANYQPAFLVAVINSKEVSSGQPGNSDEKQSLEETDGEPVLSDKLSLVDVIMLYIKRSDDLVKSRPLVLLNLLKFLKALWHGAPHFLALLEQLRKFEIFWSQLADCIVVASEMQEKPFKNLTEAEIQNVACMYQCQSNVLEIMAYEEFLLNKISHAKSVGKQTSEGVEKSDSCNETKDKRLRGLENMFSSWCNGKIFGDLIKLFASCKYDSSFSSRANVATSLFLLDVMRKLKAGDSGSLSVLLVEKISTFWQKFRSSPAFSELLSQYTLREYSQGEDLHDLVINDLFYHLQGEVEGQQIDHGAFKELSQYLMDTEFFQAYMQNHEDFISHGKACYIYDLLRLQADIGLDMWGFSGWNDSKIVAERMLCCFKDVNSMILFESSKLSALKAFTTMLSVHELTVKEEKSIPEQVFLSCISCVTQCLCATVQSLAPAVDASQDVLNILVAQADLLFLLVRWTRQSISKSDCAPILRSAGNALKVLCTFRSSVAVVRSAIEILLMLILLTAELSSEALKVSELESVEAIGEGVNVSLSLLPILCNCVELSDHCSLSLTAIDLIVKGFSTPVTWFPIIQKHLSLRYVIHKLEDKNAPATLPIILKFLLTLTHVREGSKMILNAGFLSSLKVLLANLSDDGPLPVVDNEGSLTNASDKTGKPQHIWGLSLAVVSAVVRSLGDTPSTDLVEYVMVYLLLERVHLIYYYIRAPGFPYEDHEKKRARSMITYTSLGSLKETEDTLMLMCVLAKFRNSWTKVMKEVDSQVRERIIHLLAFISRANQRRGESFGILAPLLCHPILKEELEWSRQPSFVNSRNGWFALSPIGCKLDPRSSSLSYKTMALVVKDQSNHGADLPPRTRFSDSAAIQIYRVTFLLLKFLCIQAEGAARRSEEVGFVDLAHFPELPMPDILHGLQDQCIAIVTELCETNQSSPVSHEIQDLCLLLLQIVIMALYLEFCVIQICGITPVLGHVEDFSKQLGSLIRAIDGHGFLKQSVKSLKQIVSFLYPDLVQTQTML